jgi:hypothetical protein
MAPPDDRPRVDMAAVIAADLEDDHLQYEETRNPMWAWSAIRTTMEYDIPMPPWLRDYLSTSAANLIGTAGHRYPKSPERALAALGFRRRRGRDDLREFHKAMLVIKRGALMWGRVEIRGESAKSASEDLSLELEKRSEGVDSSTLRRAFRRVKQRFLGD